MKNILQRLLKFSAVLLLWKYRPEIVVITGSVGKTSTKEAIFSVISRKYNTRKSQGNYNNEFGVPLTVIGSNASGKNPIGWFLVFMRVLVWLALPMPYPKKLVLEAGADHPRDIEYLMSFIKPNISVVTGVGVSHVEFFGNIEKIAHEKSGIVSALGKSGIAVLNYDDERARAMAEKCKGEITFYGFEQGAGMVATDLKFDLKGTYFKMQYQGTLVPVHLPHVIGTPGVYAALAGALVGALLGINLVEISKALKEFKSPPGRLRLIKGIKDTLIIDDTYNSAPNSALEALNILNRQNANRRIAVLGDMAELGGHTEEGHRKLGWSVAEKKIDLLVTVGPKSKFICEEAVRYGMSKKQILEFRDSVEARIPIQELLKPGDTVLVKGSQSMRMERVVKEIMAEPHRAKELLCRQDDSWLKNSQNF